MLAAVTWTGLCSTVGSVSGYRCVSDCRSRGHEFDPGPVSNFRPDSSGYNFHGHSPPFRWSIQEGLLAVTRESMCTKYWLTASSSLPRKKSVVRWIDRPAMTKAVDLGCKATKQTKQTYFFFVSDKIPSWIGGREKNGRRNYFMVKLQESMGRGWGQTHDPRIS